jgi:ABC-type uncharacterized transport system permease subunit
LTLAGRRGTSALIGCLAPTLGTSLDLLEKALRVLFELVADEFAGRPLHTAFLMFVRFLGVV